MHLHAGETTLTAWRMRSVLKLFPMEEIWTGDEARRHAYGWLAGASACSCP
jgi:hypothetical protein